MHRLERLINLVAALLDSERPLTAVELHERVPGYPDDQRAFRRTFERDKEALREMGVPVVLEDTSDGTAPGAQGYRIRREDYELRDPGLDPDELAALHLAASAVRMEGAGGLQALWKLGGSVVEAGPAAAVAALPSPPQLGSLFAAISERRPVEFTYRGQVRRVDPYRLSFRNGRWYLAARDRLLDEERVYRLDRFESAAEPIAGPTFERPAVVVDQPPPWEMGGSAPVSARLAVDVDHAGWAVGHLGPDAVERWEPDGSVVLAVRVTNRAAFRSFVLGFLDHAEVLGPAELRAEMAGWLESLCHP